MSFMSPQRFAPADVRIADHAAKTSGVQDVKKLANDAMNPLFSATVQATEKAIVNAMRGARTMTGFKAPARLAARCPTQVQSPSIASTVRA
jgi:L-aminopeptidase/D-esterase-like protein